MIRLFLLAALSASLPLQAQPLALLHEIVSPNEVLGGEFGISVASVSDVNGDGFDDLVVGARGEFPGGSPDDAGRAYVVDGQTGTVLHTLASPNEEANGLFGYSVGATGDLGGDGAGDMVVGAYGEEVDDLDESGRAYVFSGATGAVVASVASPGELGSARCGSSTALGSGAPSTCGSLRSMPSSTSRHSRSTSSPLRPGGR